MNFSFLKKMAIFIPNKLVSINKNMDKLISFSETADKTVTYVSKVARSVTGAAGLAKGSVDFVEAVACQDGLCALVSACGCLADGLQICTSFIPGPNITSIVTMPVSVGCKVFVWCWKRSKLPWGGC
jgi:hypothetical protein